MGGRAKMKRELFLQTRSSLKQKNLFLGVKFFSVSGSTLKGKNLLLGEQILFFKS